MLAVIKFVIGDLAAAWAEDFESKDVAECL